MKTGMLVLTVALTAACAGSAGESSLDSELQDMAGERFDSSMCTWIGANADGSFLYRISTRHQLTWNLPDASQINVLPKEFSDRLSLSEDAKSFIRANSGKYFCMVRKNIQAPGPGTVTAADLVVANAGTVEQQICAVGIQACGSVGGLCVIKSGAGFPKSSVNFRDEFAKKASSYGAAEGCFLYQDLKSVNATFSARNAQALRFEKQSLVIDTWLKSERPAKYPKP
jgi:hypothetical protein